MRHLIGTCFCTFIAAYQRRAQTDETGKDDTARKITRVASKQQIMRLHGMYNDVLSRRLPRENPESRALANPYRARNLAKAYCATHTRCCYTYIHNIFLQPTRKREKKRRYSRYIFEARSIFALSEDYLSNGHKNISPINLIAFSYRSLVIHFQIFAPIAAVSKTFCFFCKRMSIIDTPW